MVISLVYRKNMNLNCQKYIHELQLLSQCQRLILKKCDLSYFAPFIYFCFMEEKTIYEAIMKLGFLY